MLKLPSSVDALSVAALKSLRMMQGIDKARIPYGLAWLIILWSAVQVRDDPPTE